jgi:glyoxylase-like metal-dependent hydrolase (beta-lactamase superfamily II)
VVNAYLVEGTDGFALIDCGVDTPAGWAAMEAALAGFGVDPSSIHTLVVTHLHPDHVGMTPRLVEEWGVGTVMHQRAATLVPRYNDTAGFAARTRELADRHGVPSPAREAFVDVGERPPWMPIVAPPDRKVEDGDAIPLGGDRRLEVLHTPGHEAAHICLRDSLTGILFAGDHILPGITPVVMYDELFEDVLGDFLGSLARVRDLGIGLTYPAHGTIVERGSQRAEQIILHHHRRLAGMAEVATARPVTAWAVMEAVFKPHLSPLDQRLALRETLAHLEYLRLRGHLDGSEESGVLTYAR